MIQAAIQQVNSCPALQLQDITQYNGNQSLYTYAKIYVTDPNNNTTDWDSLSVTNSIYPPSWFGSQAPTYNLTYSVSGLFTVEYIIATLIQGTIYSGTSFTAGQVLFDGTNYYIVNSNFTTGTNWSASGFVNQYISDGAISVITEAQVPSTNTNTVVFTNWCSLFSCLMSKLHKINCRTVKQPLRNNICKDEEFTQVVMLYYWYEWLKVNLAGLNLTNQNDINTITTIANYVNSICSCADCCQNCSG